MSGFGSVRAVVRAHDARLRRLPTVAVLRDVILAAWRLGAIGLVAVGASGLIAWADERGLRPPVRGRRPGRGPLPRRRLPALAVPLAARAQLRPGR